MSLRASVLLAILTTFALSLLAEAGVAYVNARGKVSDEVSTALQVGRRTAERTLLSLPGSSQPYEQVIGLVRSYDGDRHLRASLLNARGEVAERSQLSSDADYAPGWVVRALSPEAETAQLGLPQTIASYSALVLETDPRSEIGEIWGDALVNVSLTGLFFAMVLALVWLILGRAIRPLETLAEAFAWVGDGHYGGRLEETGPKEFARLYAGFNRMSERLAESRRRNVALTEQIIKVQEEERADLARDLHDDVSPFLFSVDVDASAIARMAEASGGAEIAERARGVREAALQMKRDVRAIIGKLRPSSLEDLGLSASIQGLATFWKVRRPEVRFDFRLSADPRVGRFDGVVFYFVREAVTNAVKHATPKRVSVWVETFEDQLVAVVEDDGGGMPSTKGAGYGLIGVEERLSAHGGTLDIDPRGARGGVIATARIPLGEPGLPDAMSRPVLETEDVT